MGMTREEDKNLILLAIADGKDFSLMYGDGFDRDDGSYWHRERPIHFMSFDSWGDDASYKVYIEYKPVWVAGSLSFIEDYTLGAVIDFHVIRRYDGLAKTGLVLGDEACTEVITALEDKFGLLLGAS